MSLLDLTSLVSSLLSICVLCRKPDCLAWISDPAMMFPALCCSLLLEDLSTFLRPWILTWPSRLSSRFRDKYLNPILPTALRIPNVLEADVAAGFDSSPWVTSVDACHWVFLSPSLLSFSSSFLFLLCPQFHMLQGWGVTANQEASLPVGFSIEVPLGHPYPGISQPLHCDLHWLIESQSHVEMTNSQGRAQLFGLSSSGIKTFNCWT